MQLSYRTGRFIATAVREQLGRYAIFAWSQSNKLSDSCPDCDL